MHIQKIENKQEYIESTNVDAIQVGGTHRNRSKRGKKKTNIAVTKSDTLRAPSGGENIAIFQSSKGGEGKPNTNINIAIIAKSYLSIFEVLKGQV